MSSKIHYSALTTILTGVISRFFLACHPSSSVCLLANIFRIENPVLRTMQQQTP